MFKTVLILAIIASAVPSEALFKTALLKKGVAKVALAQQLPKVLPGANILSSLGSLTSFGATGAADADTETEIETEGDVIAVEMSPESSGEDIRPIIQSDGAEYYFVPVRPYTVYAYPYPYPYYDAQPSYVYEAPSGQW